MKFARFVVGFVSVMWSTASSVDQLRQTWEEKAKPQEPAKLGGMRFISSNRDMKTKVNNLEMLLGGAITQDELHPPMQ